MEPARGKRPLRMLEGLIYRMIMSLVAMGLSVCAASILLFPTAEYGVV
jgi:hypothetical protein